MTLQARHAKEILSAVQSVQRQGTAREDSTCDCWRRAAYSSHRTRSLSKCTTALPLGTVILNTVPRQFHMSIFLAKAKQNITITMPVPMPFQNACSQVAQNVSAAAILGIDDNATAEDARLAHRSLTLLLHSDEATTPDLHQLHTILCQRLSLKAPGLKPAIAPNDWKMEQECLNECFSDRQHAAQAGLPRAQIPV